MRKASEVVSPEGATLRGRRRRQLTALSVSSRSLMGERLTLSFCIAAVPDAVAPYEQSQTDLLLFFFSPGLQGRRLTILVIQFLENGTFIILLPASCQ